jgi:hypothetical protein
MCMGVLSESRSWRLQGGLTTPGQLPAAASAAVWRGGFAALGGVPSGSPRFSLLVLLLSTLSLSLCYV